MEWTVSFPDVSEDTANSPEEWECELTFTGSIHNKSAAEKKVVRDAANKNVIPVFRNLFAQWAREFKAIPAE
jgi:hypothetical protein